MSTISYVNKSKKNTKYPISLQKDINGLKVTQINDGSTIITYKIRNIQDIVCYEWEIVTGKYIATFFKRGTIMIYDGIRTSRLLAMLNCGKANVDNGIWDRIVFPEEYEDTKEDLFDVDITSLLPQLSRMYKDKDGLHVGVYTATHSTWREPLQASPNATFIDLHIVHHCDDDSYSFLLNGEIKLLLRQQVESNSKLLQIFKRDNHNFRCYYDDFKVMDLDLSKLFIPKRNRVLIDHYIRLTQYLRHLKDHIAIITNTLFSDYKDFIKRICDDSTSFKELYTYFVDTIIRGDISEELEEWLKNCLGEINLRKWDEILDDTYSKTVKIYSLFVVPTCERIILLLERFKALMEFIRYENQEQAFELDFDEILKKMIDLSSQIIKESVNSTVICNKGNKIKKLFIRWLSDIFKVIQDDDYQLKINFNSNVTDIKDMMDFLKYFKDDENDISDLKFKSMDINSNISELQDNLMNIFDKFIKLYLIDLVKIIPIEEETRINDANIILLGFDKLINNKIMIQILKDESICQYHCLLIADNLTDKICDIIIRIPKRFESYEINKAVVDVINHYTFDKEQILDDIEFKIQFSSLQGDFELEFLYDVETKVLSQYYFDEESIKA